MFSMLKFAFVAWTWLPVQGISETEMKEEERALFRIGLGSWVYVARGGKVFVWMDSQQPAVVCGSFAAEDKQYAMKISF